MASEIKQTVLHLSDHLPILQVVVPMLIAPIKIGKNAKTGAGSVVTKNVNDFVTVVGNPAKILDNA